MSEHHFGVGRERLAVNVKRGADKIAKRYGADFIWANLPGDGPRYWFCCDNLGFPFDKAVEDAVYADLKAANLYNKMFPEE